MEKDLQEKLEKLVFRFVKKATNRMASFIPNWVRSDSSKREIDDYFIDTFDATHYTLSIGDSIWKWKITFLKSPAFGASNPNKVLKQFEIDFVTNEIKELTTSGEVAQ